MDAGTLYSHLPHHPPGQQRGGPTTRHSAIGCTPRPEVHSLQVQMPCLHVRFLPTFVSAVILYLFPFNKQDNSTPEGLLSASLPLSLPSPHT